MRHRNLMLTAALIALSMPYASELTKVPVAKKHIDDEETIKARKQSAAEKRNRKRLKNRPKV